MSWGFYKPGNNPTGLTGAVGGVVDLTAPVKGGINDIFPTIGTGASLTGTTQYRLIYVRNESFVRGSFSGQSPLALAGLLGVDATREGEGVILDAEYKEDPRLWISNPEYTGHLAIGLATGTNQVITNSLTAPAGVTFTTPTVRSSGLSLQNVNNLREIGIWLRLNVSGYATGEDFSTAILNIDAYTKTDSTFDMSKGYWEPPFNISGSADVGGLITGPKSEAVHMCLIPKGPNRGKVLIWPHERAQYLLSSQTMHIIDPYLRMGNPQKFMTADIEPYFNSSLQVNENGSEWSLFCAAQMWLPDGTLLVQGGEDELSSTLIGAPITFLYHPDTGSASAWTGWQRLPDSAVKRWYPTLTFIGSGKYATVGGIDDSKHLSKEEYEPAYNTYEILDYSGLQSGRSSGYVRYNTGQIWFTGIGLPSGGRIWTGPLQLPGYALHDLDLGIYPRIKPLTGGQLFTSGPQSYTYRVDNPITGATGVWTLMHKFDFFPVRRDDYSSIQLPDSTGLIGIFGGLFGFGVDSTISEAYVCQSDAPGFGRPPTGWDMVAIPPMLNPRRSTNSAILPTEEILFIGGDTDLTREPNHILGLHPVQAARAALVYRSGSGETPAKRWVSGSWDVWAIMDSDRSYHATVCLLPDGRVICGGGDIRQWDFQIFRPPYLLTGKIRPVITSSTATAPKGGTITITYKTLPSNVSIQKVVLIPPTAVTHSIDMNGDRSHRARISTSSSTSLTAVLESNELILWPGYYMVFIVTSEGIPSEAAWLQVTD